ncbi:MAG: hypothetical protein ABFD79_00195 [Phycisphaerales bacterium]
MLHEKAFHLQEEVLAAAALHPEKLIVRYGEFSYQAGRREYARRIIWTGNAGTGRLF